MDNFMEMAHEIGNFKKVNDIKESYLVFYYGLEKDAEKDNYGEYYTIIEYNDERFEIIFYFDENENIVDWWNI